MNEIEELKQRIAKLEGPSARLHPALPEGERIKLAAELGKLRADRLVEAKTLKAATEKAFNVADAAIRKARATLGDVEDVEIVAERGFEARQAELVRVLRRGEPDVIGEFRSRLATEQARTWNAIADSGAHVVNQDTRFSIDKGLQARRRCLSDLGEALAAWAESGDRDAALRARFETEMSKIPTAETIIAEARAVPAAVLPEQKTADPGAVAAALGRIFQTGPRLAPGFQS